MEETIEHDIEGSYRDWVATITKEGKRNFINPKKPKGPYYNLRTWFSIFYLIVFFCNPLYKSTWRASGNDQCAPKKIHHFRDGFLATGFFHFWNCHAHFCCFYYPVYCSFWESFLRMGMSPNHFYGNGFPKD